MGAMLLAAPAAEPLTLTEAKLFLRVEHDDDDALILALIAAARRQVEAQTRRALITQTWRLVRDAWPPTGRIRVLPLPLRAVTAARVYDADGAVQPLDPGRFIPDLAAGVLALASFALPQPGRAAAGIEIDLALGYGDEAAAVPAPLVQAVRLLLAHWYENRAVFADAAVPLPHSVAALLAPYRVLLP